MIIEAVSVPSTVSTQDTEGEVISLDDLVGSKEYRAITPTAYIPANFGASSKVSLTLSVYMMGSFNALERSKVSQPSQLFFRKKSELVIPA